MIDLTPHQRLLLEHIDGGLVAHRDLMDGLRREHDLSDDEVTSALVGLSVLGLLRLERAIGLTSEGLALVGQTAGGPMRAEWDDLDCDTAPIVEVADDPAPTLDGPLPRGAIR